MKVTAMSPRPLPFLAVCVAFIFFASACGDSKPSPALASVNVNLAADPETLDPAMATGVPESRVINSLMNGLTRLDENGSPQPAIAERWEANKSRTAFTFYLRKAQWSNGEPVTANDFVNSWKRAIDPATASDYAYQLYSIAGAEDIHLKKASTDSLGARAIDDLTLEVHLSGPTPFFHLLSHIKFITRFIFLPSRAMRPGTPDRIVMSETDRFVLLNGKIMNGLFCSRTTITGMLPV